MTIKLTCLLTMAVLMFGVSLTSSCDRIVPKGKEVSHEDSGESLERGPHGGRLLKKGAFSLELIIFETGTPPHYRIYGYNDDKLISPDNFSAKVSLERFGGRVDNFTFSPVENFLTSTLEVEEPHSFMVQVTAQFAGKEYSWSFESYEGRTQIADEVAKISGIRTAKAKSRELESRVQIRGKIIPSEHRIAHVIPRFFGVVRSSHKHIGDFVEKGEVLAVIESNQSLQPFEVKSQISGTVINGHVVVGEFIPENQWIYVIADLSEVWADFFISLQDEIDVKIGQTIKFASVRSESSYEGQISYVAPYADDSSQTRLVRVFVQNPKQTFLPGMFIHGHLVVSKHNAPVVVKQSAIQTFRDWNVVFAKSKDVYEIKPVELGLTDGEWVEITHGLAAGEEYVSENSFLIKADILKSGASHDH